MKDTKKKRKKIEATTVTLQADGWESKDKVKKKLWKSFELDENKEKKQRKSKNC